MEEKERNLILDKIESGEAYTATTYGGRRRWSPHIEDVIVLPITKETKKKRDDRLLTLFDNTTILLQGTTIVICQQLFCPNDHHIPYDAEVFNIVHGAIVNKAVLCEDCVHMVKKYVGECKEQTFKMADELKVLPNFERKPLFDNYLYIKKGYLAEHDFSNDIVFDKKHVAERMDEWKERGAHRRELNKVRRSHCDYCVKYRTAACKKGFRSSDYNRVEDCKFTPDEMRDALEVRLKDDFGSMGNALWYFSQCGTEIDYLDEGTKRHSDRLIGVPAGINGEDTPTGFFMSMHRYPYNIGFYTSRSSTYWRQKQNEKDKRENYISTKELKKRFPEAVVKTRYKKVFRDAVLMAYMFYKYRANTPGSSAHGFGNANYLVSLGIEGASVEVNIGNSRYKWTDVYKDFNDYFNSSYVGITKQDMKKKKNSEVQK
jgi:hypothetical protein